MTPEEFVNALRHAAIEPAIDGTLEALQDPPGRRPRRALVEMSAWYARVSETDRSRLRELASMVAHEAVFGVLAVLDGARFIESTPEKGVFRLTFSKGGSQWELTSETGMALHDFLAEPEEDPEKPCVH